LGDVERAWRLLEGVSEVIDTADRRYDAAALHELIDLLAQLRSTGSVHSGARG
jgi:hypothetical protein